MAQPHPPPRPLARADFETDEDWQRYKEGRENMPRAAFQFGVKRADGRKSHKELEKGVDKWVRARGGGCVWGWVGGWGWVVGGQLVEGFHK